MNWNHRIAAAASLALFGAFASAQVAFNDFSSDSNSSTYGYDTGTGWTVSGANGLPGISEAASQFTSGATGSILDLILPVANAEGSGDVSVQIFSDNGGAVGGTLIEGWTMATTGPFGQWTTPSVLNGDGSGMLVDRTSYWVVVSAVDEANSNLWAAWNYNDDGVSGTGAYNNGAGWSYLPGATIPAFEIDVQATPEPVSMLALGGALLVLRRRRARK